MQGKIELLGGLRLTVGAEVVTRFRTRKTAELLAYLAYFYRQSHSREVLVEMLWPECDTDAGRHNLSMALSSLRQQSGAPEDAGQSLLLADRHTVGLNTSVVSSDIATFEAALAAADRAADDAERRRALAAAVELYQGELLPGHYEDWIFPEQQRMAELFFQALRRLTPLLAAAGETDRAIQYALRAVRMDRLREETHRELIRLYIASNQPDAALRQYRELERLLREELGCGPDADTRALLLTIPPRSAIQAGGGVRASGVGNAGDREQDAARDAIQNPQSKIQKEPTPAESIGGAVPLGSQLYIARAADAEFQQAVARGDSIVLVKGARQVGKTSLLARGLQQARSGGAKILLTHFQMFNAAQLESADALLLALAETIAEQLDLDAIPAATWDARRGANQNFRRFLLREVLSKTDLPLVWGLDEVDRLFGCAFGGEIFALFRSWHDERALDPNSPLSKLTLAIAYATEAHLFITDLNQSPFNVGTRLTLEDFSSAQIAELNSRCGGPLRGAAEQGRFEALVGGQPYLVRRGLDELARRRCDLETLETFGDREESPFADHLRRLISLLIKDFDLTDAVRAVLRGEPCPTRDAFHRLRSAGILAGDSLSDARPRCNLYRDFLASRLL